MIRIQGRIENEKIGRQTIWDRKRDSEVKWIRRSRKGGLGLAEGKGVDNENLQKRKKKKEGGKANFIQNNLILNSTLLSTE